MATPEAGTSIWNMSIIPTISIESYIGHVENNDLFRIKNTGYSRSTLFDKANHFSISTAPVDFVVEGHEPSHPGENDGMLVDIRPWKGRCQASFLVNS